MSFLNDFNDANASFKKFKDEITKHMKGDIIDIESRDNSLAKLFDMYSGVDAIHIYKQKIRGVAIRSQWGANWGTFSIRHSRLSGARTEYEKRHEAIYGNGGFWYPYITIQAYFDKRDPNSLLSYGIVKTKDLYDYIKNDLDFFLQNQTRTCPEGNIFIWIRFVELHRAGKHIIIGQSSH